MADNYEVIAAIYPTEDGAKNTLDQLQQMKKDDIIHIIDAATMRKEADGKVHTYQADIPHAKSAAIKGGVIGAVVGIIFPPAILAATALGAAAGGDRWEDAERRAESRWDQADRKRARARDIRHNRGYRRQVGRYAGAGPRGLLQALERGPRR